MCVCVSLTGTGTARTLAAESKRARENFMVEVEGRMHSRSVCADHGQLFQNDRSEGKMAFIYAFSLVSMPILGPYSPSVPLGIRILIQLDNVNQRDMLGTRIVNSVPISLGTVHTNPQSQPFIMLSLTLSLTFLNRISPPSVVLIFSAIYRPPLFVLSPSIASQLTLVQSATNMALIDPSLCQGDYT